MLDIWKLLCENLVNWILTLWAIIQTVKVLEKRYTHTTATEHWCKNKLIDFLTRHNKPWSHDSREIEKNHATCATKSGTETYPEPLSQEQINNTNKHLRQTMQKEKPIIK